MLSSLGIDERPADPLYQLVGEVIAREVAGGDFLVQHHSCVRLLNWFSGDEDSGHGRIPLWPWIPVRSMLAPGGSLGIGRASQIAPRRLDREPS
jgi:hypothetical protein